MLLGTMLEPVMFTRDGSSHSPFRTRNTSSPFAGRSNAMHEVPTSFRWPRIGVVVVSGTGTPRHQSLNRGSADWPTRRGWLEYLMRPNRMPNWQIYAELGDVPFGDEHWSDKMMKQLGLVKSVTLAVDQGLPNIQYSVPDSFAPTIYLFDISIFLFTCYVNNICVFFTSS
jgi:hypothetical protein